jgi:subtilase family serine protease
MKRQFSRRTLSLSMNKTGAISLALTAISLLATVNADAQGVMTHHVREAVNSGEAQALGRLPANQVMRLDIVLLMRNQAGLESFLSEVYDPSSPSYRHFLTVPEFSARFGPTEKDYAAVVQFAKANGMQVTGGTRDGMEVQVKGPVSAIQAAFHVNLHTYQHPTEGRTFFAPDREPTTTLPFNLWHVTGLDNFSIPHPLYVSKSEYAAAHGISPDAVVKHATTGSGPSASFLGSDMRAAYYGGTALTGAGLIWPIWRLTSKTLARRTRCRSPCFRQMARAPPAWTTELGATATIPSRRST